MYMYTYIYTHVCVCMYIYIYIYMVPPGKSTQSRKLRENLEKTGTKVAASKIHSFELWLYCLYVFMCFCQTNNCKDKTTDDTTRTSRRRAPEDGHPGTKVFVINIIMNIIIVISL